MDFIVQGFCLRPVLGLDLANPNAEIVDCITGEKASPHVRCQQNAKRKITADVVDMRTKKGGQNWLCQPWGGDILGQKDPSPCVYFTQSGGRR
jgi:hypothetical protein